MSGSFRTSYHLLLISSLTSWMWIWSIRLMLSTLMPAIGLDLNLSIVEQDTLIGLSNLSNSVGLYVFGRLGHILGRKRVILFGILMSVVLTFVFSLQSTFPWLILLATCSGFFYGAYLPSATSILADHYRQSRRGLVFAVHESGATVGMFLGSELVAVGVLSFAWRQILGWWTLFGLFPLFLYLLAAPSDHRPTREECPHRGTVNRDNSRWSRKLTIMVVLAYTGDMAAVLGLIAVLPVYMVSDWGVAISVTAGWIAVSRLPAPIGQLIAGSLSDRYGRRPVLVLITIMVCLSTIAIAYSPFNAIFILALTLQIFAGSAFIPVMHANVSDITSLDERSSKIGLGMSAGGIIGSGIVPIAIGLLAIRVGYGVAFALPIALSLLSVVAVTSMRFRSSASIK